MSFLFTVNIFAVNTYSQTTRVTVEVKNASLEDVLNVIKQKTEFSFWYKDKDVQSADLYSFSAKNQSVNEILDKVLQKKSLAYTIYDKHIVIYTPEKTNVVSSKNAQGIKITGTVTDAKSGDPLPGATVSVKGSSTGTITDLDGKFSLEVPDEKSELSITFIGYTPQMVLVGSNTVFNIKLSEVQQSLDEVLVIGYGVAKKKLSTGASVQLKSDELVKDHVMRVEGALQGKTPGVSVTKQSSQPGSDYNIVIRGAGSVNGSSPLVIVDGVPGSMNMLAPEDIASIDILKDAASAAIYGTKGANGVILVTTKKGKSGEMQITYDTYVGVSNPYKKYSVLNAQQYMTIMNEAQLNSSLAPFYTTAQVAAAGAGTDWQKEAFSTNAISQNHHIGITGGNDKSSFSASVSYSKENGLMNYEDKSKYERFGFRINSEHKLKPWLKFGENLTFTHTNSTGVGVGNIYSNTTRGLLNSTPIMNVHDTAFADGYARTPYLSPDQGNPLAGMHYSNNNLSGADKVIGDMFAEVEFTKYLKFRSDFGGNLSMNSYQEFNPAFDITQSWYNKVSNGTQNLSRNYYYNFDNTLTFQKDFGLHNVMVMVGTNVQDNWSYYQNAKAAGGLFTDFDHSVLSNYTSIVSTDIAGSVEKTDALLSYFGRASYNYGEKYMATATIRRDGSSRFGANNRFGYFPSVSAGWVVSKESFMDGLSDNIEFLKLRASWGQNGKEPSKPYQFMATLANEHRYYYFGTTEVKSVGYSPNILPNPDLKWEATEQSDLGIDARFLKNFSFTFDWYNKTSKDWIVEIPVSALTGQKTTFINGGNVSNKGIEMELGYTKTIGDVNFDIRGNVAFNKNNVTNVPTSDGIIHGLQSVPFNGADEIARVAEGHPVGYFWGFKTAGIFQSEAEVASYKNNGKIVQPDAKPGDVKFVDLNGDGVIDSKDKTEIGDPNAHYIYGLNLSASYKGFDVSVNLQGQGGNQNFEGLRSNERYYNNYSSSILGRWTGPGTSNSIPRVTRGDEPNQNWIRISDLYIHDAAFLKVKSVNIGYDLKKILPKNIPVSQLRLYVSASNLLTFTKYDGSDPEVGYSPNPYGSGVDLGTYPTARTFLFGANIKF